MDIELMVYHEESGYLRCAECKHPFMAWLESSAGPGRIEATALVLLIMKHAAGHRVDAKGPAAAHAHFGQAEGGCQCPDSCQCRRSV